jgi:hypothetical protein
LATGLSKAANTRAEDDESVSQLTGVYKHGQVFLTWLKAPDSFIYYKVYRSPTPITSGNQLPTCEYLGWTNSTSSIDQDLTHHDKDTVYLVIDSGSAPLGGETGLFVATTLADGNYYYAVTTVSNGVEDNTIIPGTNSFQTAISEKTEEPKPVYQQSRYISYKNVDIYALFTSMKNEPGGPLMNKAGFIANDFAVCKNGKTNQPLRIRFHGGGADFLYNITAQSDSEINISPEHLFPSGDNASWWGANENFDLYNGDNNLVPPTSGINYNFVYLQVTRIIDWAIAHLPVDSNRIYMEGSSLGCIGAYFYSLTYPDRIAAVKLSGSVFDLGFKSDYNPVCSLNPGRSNRESGDEQFGTTESNLMTNLGDPTYDVLNGGWVTYNFNERNYPVIYSINGKNDSIVGWTEKTIYYDSVNAHHIGGYYFYDGRGHGGEINTTWADGNFDILRYRNNRSFPAFANCSANEDYGDGHSTSGAPFGSVNGFLDWKDEVIDDSLYWESTIFLRDLLKQDYSLYSAPPVCTVDVTPRRLQKFHASPGDTLWWAVKHAGEIVQSGQQVYSGGIIVIPQVMVYKDSIQLELTTDSTFLSGNIGADLVTIFPNPFHESAFIRWQQMTSGPCSVKIYDIQGRLIKTLVDGDLAPGIYQMTWNGDDQNGKSRYSGIYFVRIEKVSGVVTKRLVLIN